MRNLCESSVQAGTSFGGLLRNLRVQAGLSQKALAEELGIYHSVVSWWETSLLRPNSEKRVRLIARALNAHLPENERFEEDGLVSAWKELRRFYDEEAHDLRERRNRRRPSARNDGVGHDARRRGAKASRSVLHPFGIKIDLETMERIEDLRSLAYPARSHVVRALLTEALKSKRIVAKIKNA